MGYQYLERKKRQLSDCIEEYTSEIKGKCGVCDKCVILVKDSSITDWKNGNRFRNYRQKSGKNLFRCTKCKSVIHNTFQHKINGVYRYLWEKE